MPGGFDGSGNFTRTNTWIDHATQGIKIRATEHDEHDQAIANALSLMICKDGRSSPTAAINWGAQKITNLAPGAADSDAVTFGQMKGVRDFPSAISITGSHPESVLKFTGSTGPYGLSFTTPSPDGMFFGVSNENTWIWNDKADASGNTVMVLTETGALTLSSLSAGTVQGPLLYLERKVAVANGALGMIYWNGRNSGAATFSYGYQYVISNNIVAGQETSSWNLTLASSGAMVNVLSATASMLTTSGGVNAPNGNITFASHLIGAGAHVYLAPTSPGSVTLRPNGPNNASGAFSVDTSGNAYATGGVWMTAVNCSGAINFSGAIASNSNVVMSANANNLHFRPNGGGNAAGEMYLTTSGQLVLNGTLSTSGELSTTNTVRTGTHIIGQGSDLILSANGALPRQILMRPNGYASGSEQLIYASTGNLTIGNQGYKAVAGDWAAASDARIKTVTGDYETGLDAILALQVRRFTFRGNDVTRQPTEEDTAPAVSAHAAAAEAGTEYVGLIAQEAETVMPEIVTQTDAYIDNQAVSDFRILDTTNITYALVNAVKELAGRIQTLEGAPA